MMLTVRHALACLVSGFLMLNVLCSPGSVLYAAPVEVIEVEAHPKGRLSFEFQNIDIRALLQLIAKNSGLNFIISETVKGNITLNLRNVTWREALDVILRTHGLASRRIANVMFISTIEEITANETKQLQAQESLANLAPLRSTLIRLKYTNATDMANLLKGQQGTLLTARGEVAVDPRTNSLIIKDTALNLDDIISSIRRLDIPARQVLIEARIVNVDMNYEQQLGARFGVSDTRHLSGTLQGASEIARGVDVGDVPFPQRLNFNIPANPIFGNRPGSIALALARVGPLLIDLELSALEGERHAQVIARPRVVTSNQQKAVIQTGEEIPYQEATSSGATSVVFKKAVLSLEIVPQITPDNKIILKIKATQDTRGENLTVGATTGGIPITIPAINTQEVDSNVLLNDNETIVLGGVYRKIKQDDVERVPFFGSIPIVGYLFRHNGERVEKHELLIFVTPKIITANIAPPRACKTVFRSGLPGLNMPGEG